MLKITDKTIVLTGTFLGGLAVILGAYGAHGLEKVVDADAVASFKTGVRYQMYHALLLLVVGIIPQLPLKAKKAVYLFLLIGVILFSFSIYALVLDAPMGANFGAIGFITPIGGLFLIVGWLLLAQRVYKYL